MSTVGRREGSGASGHHVIHEPLAVYLLDPDVARDSGGEEHLVCRLKDALEVRRETLREGELRREALERRPPGELPFGARDLEQTIQPSRDGTAEGQIPGWRERDDVIGRDVGPHQ